MAGVQTAPLLEELRVVMRTLCSRAAGRVVQVAGAGGADEAGQVAGAGARVVRLPSRRHSRQRSEAWLGFLVSLMCWCEQVAFCAWGCRLCSVSPHCSF